MSSAVSCPVLKVPEIVLCLADMRVVISADDIKHPTAATVRGILELFVDKLMGVKRDDLHQPQFHAMHLLSNPELHDESIAEITTIKSILRLLTSAGVPDASITDITEPTYLRMKLILSCLINLIKHREDVLEHYTHYSHQWELLLQNRAMVEDEVNRLTEDSDRNKPQFEADKATIEQLTAGIAQLTEAITAYNKQHLALRDSIHSSKAEIKQLNAAIAASNTATTAIAKDNAAQRQHIIKSPERLKRTLADLTNTVTQSKAELADQTTQSRDLAQRVLLLTKTDGRLKKRLTSLREIETLQGRTRLLVSQQREYERNITHLQQIAEGMKAEEEEVQKRTTAVGDKVAGLKRNYERRKLEAKLALDEVEEELGVVVMEGREEGGRKEELERAVERVRRELVEAKAAHDSGMRMMSGKEREMELAVQNWHSKLLQGMASVDQPHAPMTPKSQSSAEQ